MSGILLYSVYYYVESPWSTLLREWCCWRYSRHAAIVAEQCAGHETIDWEGWFTLFRILMPFSLFFLCAVTQLASFIPELKYI